MTPFENPAVAQVFDAYPPKCSKRLLALRQLIFDTATITGVGKLEETLKWGEPAYITAQSKSGSTIRIAWKAKTPSQYGIYFNCQAMLIETFTTLFPGGGFKFEGNRAIVFDVADALPKEELAFCIAAALTYHLKKPRAPRAKG
nr:DUF1801 domain-containing protein [Rhodoferax sp.]